MSKFPAQYRLTFKAQYDAAEYVNGEYVRGPETAPLAFAQVYEPHLKTFAKKQNTQDVWAYGNRHHYDEDGKVHMTENKWVLDTDNPSSLRASKLIEQTNMVPEHLQPRIIDNVPLKGFQIQQSVSRYSTSNKLWRVLDPRGFELEITTANLEELMMGCVIDHGLIKGTCIWALTKKLVLLS